MNTIEFLEATKELINTPEKWIKGRLYAYNAQAKCSSYCISGAWSSARQHLATIRFRRWWGPVGARAADAALVNAVQSRGYTNIASFNDDPKTTHTDVMNLFDEVITKLKKE